MKYHNAILGGTFDRLHVGHKKLIQAALENAEQVDIGLTMPELYQKKFLAQVIEPYANREKTLQEFAPSAKIIPLTNMYGESLTKIDIEAIFVTEVTYANAVHINKERDKIGFPPLVIEQVPFAIDTSGKVITSERIRRGEIDREGFMYKNLFQQTLTLPDSLREELHKPIGNIVSDFSELERQLPKYHTVITVGDIITQTLATSPRKPDVSVIDYKTRRNTIEHSLETSETLHALNKAGFIEAQAVTLLEKALTNHSTLIIDGEEDLLALPAILLAPLGSVVLYGQYNIGIVVNEVTEEMKHQVKKLIRKMSC